jgi:hypothetical protein
MRLTTLSWKKMIKLRSPRKDAGLITGKDLAN